MYACGFENKKLWFGSLKAFCFLKYGRALRSTLIGTRWTNILLSVAVKTLDHWQSSEENPKSKMWKRDQNVSKIMLWGSETQEKNCKNLTSCGYLLLRTSSGIHHKENLKILTSCGYLLLLTSLVIYRQKLT